MTKTLLILAAGMLAFSTAAQDMSTEIDVERTVDVVENTASPLSSVIPSILPNPNTPRPLSMVEYTLTGVPGVMADTLPPADATGIPGAWPWRGYAAVGYLPTFNLDVRAGYAFISNSSSGLNAGIRYTGESHTGAVSAQGSKIKAIDNNFALTVNGVHRFSGLTFTGAGAYEHYAVSSPYADGGAEKFSRGADGATLGLSLSGRNFVDWSVGAHMQYMGFSKTFTTAEVKPSTFLIGADARADYSFNDRAGVELALGVESMSSSTYGTVTPAFTYNSGIFSARAGVRMDIVSASDLGNFYVAPDVQLAARTSMFTVWIDCKGGVKHNSLSDAMAFSPYMAGVNRVDMSRTKVDATLGVRIGGARGLSGTLLGYYADVQKAAVLSVIERAVALTSMNRSGWGASARLDYSMALLNLRAHAGFTLYSNTTDHVYPTADCAHTVTKIGVKGTPIRPLNVGIEWELREGRKYVEYRKSGQWDYIGLGDVNNLSVEGVYAVTPALSVGLKLENLLCRRWELVPGVWSQRLHGLLTAQLNF